MLPAFIRQVGNVVAIQNGAIATIWDHMALPEPYQTVADRMAAYIRTLTITDVFLTKLGKIGTPVSHEPGITWHHFAVDVPRTFISRAPDEMRGTMRTNFQMLKRAVTEITDDAIDTVLDLIATNAIYRGQEHKRTVEGFKQLKSAAPMTSSSGRTSTTRLHASATPSSARCSST